MSQNENLDQARDLSNGVEYLVVWNSKTERDGQEIHIYGNSEGLRSLAQKLIAIADCDQSKRRFPDDDSEHRHYKVGCNVESPQDQPILTIGRVDSKLDHDHLRECFAPLAPNGGKTAIR